jgi:hypothetical protein
MARPLSKKPKSDLSRLRRFAQNHLGVIMGDDMNQAKEFRNDHLDLLDRYYDSEQYEDLQDWNEALKSDEYVPIRDRKPRIMYNVAKVLVEKVAAKLIGESTFPKFVIEDDDDDTEFFRVVGKTVKFRAKMIDPVKNMLKAGACFVRYYLVNGAVKIEFAKSKYCYPIFDEMGELDSCEIKYVYEDQNDKDQNGTPIKKWYKLVLTKQADIMFDNPTYRPGSRPTFEEAGRMEHGLGWVQGEWLQTHSDKFDFDGYSLYGDILGFIDELNYSLSQTSQAVSYNQEPQLVFNKMDEDELDKLVRSSTKAWNLGREGEAKYLETDMKGIEQAGDRRDEMRNRMLEVVRVVISDPEQIKGNTQSGEALKQLYAPMLELIDDLRAALEPQFTNLLIKIGMTCLHYNAMGAQTVIQTPPGYVPSSFDFTVQWPNIFPPTLADINTMAQAANVLATAQIISRESLTKWIIAQTNIADNAEEEIKKLAVQEPLPSPFGSFGDGG